MAGTRFSLRMHEAAPIHGTRQTVPVSDSRSSQLRTAEEEEEEEEL